MPLNMGISQKGLVLISVPLAFELIFVGILVVLLGNAESAADKEERSKLVIGAADQLVQHFYNAGSSLIAYGITHNPSFRETFAKACDHIPNDVQTLSEMTSSNPDEQEPIRRIKLLSDAGVDMLQAAMRSKETGSKSLELINMGNRDQMTDISDQLNAELEKIVKIEKGAQSSSGALGKELSRQKELTRQMIRQALGAGIALNVFIAVGLAVFFARGIARRLRSVRDNTQRLATGQPLFPHIGGSDEIADLDRAFHHASEQLAEAARKKQEFLDMISHDLRTPLTGLKITLENIESGTYGQLSERGQMRVRNSENSLAQLLNLVNELLEIEKLESGSITIDRARVSLLGILQRSVESVRSLAETSGITINLQEKECEVFADEMRVSQVTINLLSNALKFSPAGSTIEITTESDPQYIEVRVSDQGRGIPAHLQESIFHRYKQVERSDETEKKGAGLGLAICKLIVEHHGGKIGVTSKEGEGSTFWFRLPPA